MEMSQRSVVDVALRCYNIEGLILCYRLRIQAHWGGSCSDLRDSMVP